MQEAVHPILPARLKSAERVIKAVMAGLVAAIHV
jgi:hypothetical protein